MNVKKLILLVGVVFIGFWLFKDPQGLADVAVQAGTWVADATGQLFEAVIDFATSFLDQTV